MPDGGGYQPADLERWFPRDREKFVPAGTFEIGLVLAGAVSAGAYTAGVLDFLFEALETWNEAKQADVKAGRTGANATVPHHDVLLRVICGASAGGMNGAIAAASLGTDYPHVRANTDPATAARNPFYAAWVKNIDITSLLGTEDLKTGFHSLLDCSVLEQIVRSTIQYQGAPLSTDQKAARTWIANPLPVVLTVGNLRGIPYDVHFRSDDPRFGYSMMRHADYVGFAVPNLGAGTYDKPAPDLLELSEPRQYTGGWQALGMTALATGAFPAFLAARPLNRRAGDYDWRHPLYDQGDAPVFDKPDWPNAKAPDPYAYLCVDGGVMNNEPFALAHQRLAGCDGQNPRDGMKANRAVLMVDPFVEPVAPGPDTDHTLFDIPLALMSAYKNDARFVVRNLDLMMSEDIYSRFLVAPSRDPVSGKNAIASGGLGGFFGFFSEAYRRHDFLLGRRNCQRFLQTSFTLPAGNPLFRTDEPWTAAGWRGYFDALDPTHKLVIPLVGACAVEEVLPAWPAGQFARSNDLDRRIGDRVDAVASRARDQIAGAGVSGWVTKRYLDAGLFFVKSRILDKAKAAIDDAAKQVNAGAPEKRMATPAGPLIS